MLQMANELLNNDERLLLIEKYKEDKLNSPPSNIKDETLITNYGTDEQKARLQAAPAAKAPKATENKTASPAAGASAGTGTEPAPAAEPAAPKAEDTVINKGIGAQDGGFIEGTAQSAAEQTKPVEQPAGNTGDMQAAPAPDENQNYVRAFNDYIDVFKTMPKDNLTAAELDALVANKKEADKAAANEAEELRRQALQHEADKTANMVTIINNETKESTVVSRFTWDRFIGKDGTHSLKPETPAELQ